MLFIEYLWRNPEFYLSWIVLITFSICMHEAAHAWTAAWRGDLTAQWTGHLSLNPLKVMGTTSLIMLVLCGIAWGAVPVDRRALRTRGNWFLVSAAGLVANLCLALVFAVLTVLLIKDAGRVIPADVAHLATGVTVLGLKANLFLFLFNLLPVPMLDGWEVFATIFPPMDAWRARMSNVGLLILLLLFLSPAGAYLWVAVDRLSDLVLALLAVAWRALGG